MLYPKQYIADISEFIITNYFLASNMQNNFTCSSAHQFTQNSEINQSLRPVNPKPLIRKRHNQQQGNNYLGIRGKKIKNGQRNQNTNIQQQRKEVQNYVQNWKQQKMKINLQKKQVLLKPNSCHSKLTQRKNQKVLKKDKNFQKKQILPFQNQYIDLISQQEKDQIQEPLQKKHSKNQKKLRKAAQKQQAHQQKVLKKQIPEKQTRKRKAPEQQFHGQQALKRQARQQVPLIVQVPQIAEPNLQKRKLSKEQTIFTQKFVKFYQKVRRNKSKHFLSKLFFKPDNCKGFGQIMFRRWKVYLQTLNSPEGLKFLLNYYEKLVLPLDCPQFKLKESEIKNLIEELQKLIKQILIIIHAGGCKIDLKILFDQINLDFFDYMNDIMGRKQKADTARMVYMRSLRWNPSEIIDLQMHFRYQNLARYIICQVLCDYLDGQIKYDSKNTHKKQLFSNNVRKTMQAMRKNKPIPGRVNRPKKQPTTQIFKRANIQVATAERVYQNVHYETSSGRLNQNSNLNMELFLRDNERQIQRQREREIQRQREIQSQMESESEIDDESDSDLDNNVPETVDSLIENAFKDFLGQTSRNQINQITRVNLEQPEKGSENKSNSDINDNAAEFDDMGNQLISRNLRGQNLRKNSYNSVFIEPNHESDSQHADYSNLSNQQQWQGFFKKF